MTQPFTRKAWIAALRDPKNGQVPNRLKTAAGYCCLGLALEVAGVPAIPYPGGDFTFGGCLTFPDDEQLAMIGITQRVGSLLASCNDEGRVPFPDIADFLEKGVFSPRMVTHLLPSEREHLTEWFEANPLP